jgi:DNA-binding NarL/FixJ family response regulator
MTRIVVAEDEDLVRDGLVAIVSSHPGYEVVAEAADGVEAVEAVERTDPDVVLMDIRMPRQDGFEATRRITSMGARARVLVLTTMETDEVLQAALAAGASGFLLKSSPREQLWLGIDVVAAGDALIAPGVTRRLIERLVGSTPAAPTAGPMQLTERQRDVVLLVARGMSNSEIAEQLFLAETTVKSHISDVLTRHGLRDRTQLVVRAYESGLVRAGA